MKVNTQVPITFEKVNQVDDRFVQVKIWLMHLGKNYNQSIFDKEVVIEAMETLKNTPILGYIEESMVGDKDFRGHEMELVVEDGELKTKYIGSAYGVIPQDCNPRFEQKMGDTGEMLDYLVVDGLLWTKFDDAVSIIEDSGNEVSQSMELHDNFDGYWDDEGWFNFTKFSFYGACMLGENILPAMQKASVEKVFSTNVIQNEIAKKLEEFNQAFSKNHFKEVEHQMTLEELLVKYEISAEDLTEKGINSEEFSIEDLEAKIKEVFASDEEDEEKETETEMEKDDKDEEDKSDSEKDEDKANSEFEKEDEDEDEDDGSDEDDKEPEEKFTRHFELSHDDIRTKMYENLDSHISMSGNGDDWHYIISIYETHLVAENGWGDKFFKIDYSKDGENIVLGGVNEVFAMFLTSDEKGALELMRSNYEKLKQENSTLKEFQADILKEQHVSEVEELFSNFSKLEESDLSEIRENVHNYSIEEIESKCYEILGRKMASFSKKEKQSSVHMKFSKYQSESKTGIDHIFAKHGIKNN